MPGSSPGGPTNNESLTSDIGSFVLGVTLSNGCGASQLTNFAAMIYYRKTLFGRGPKLTAVH
jgi:hypothetical protein